MFIKSTGKKNLIDLFSIKQQIARGQELPIKDDEYWNSDIQTALKMGWITATGVPIHKMENGEEVSVMEEQIIECENTHHRPIALNQNDREIRPGQRFNLKESEIDTPAIKNAISNGMIKVVSSLSHKSTSNETTISIDPTAADEELFEDEGFEEVVDVGLDTNEEISTPAVVVEDTKGIIWNKQEKVKTVPSMTNVITEDGPTEVDPNEGDPKGKSIVMDPNKARFLKYAADDKITFVDQEGEEERIMQHPTMNVDNKMKAVAGVKYEKQLRGEEAEVDVLGVMVEDEDEARRKAHPVLGKEERKDVDFLDDLDDLEVRVGQHPVLGKEEVDVIE